MEEKFVGEDFPMGVRFHPSDREAITYLLHKATGNKQKDFMMIATADLYGEREPWEIFGDEDRKEGYFFTNLKSKSTKKNKDDQGRVSRNIGKGTWDNKGQKIAIYNRRKQVVGFKRTFRYKTKNDDDQSSRSRVIWLLKEYILSDDALKKCRFKDYALCVLKKKKGTSGGDHGGKELMIVDQDQGLMGNFVGDLKQFELEYFGVVNNNSQDDLSNNNNIGLEAAPAADQPINNDGLIELSNFMEELDQEANIDIDDLKQMELDYFGVLNHDLSNNTRAAAAAADAVVH